jgi:heavy metal efflux system protein
VVIGGVIGAMVMSLLVLRVLYLVFQSPFERRKAKERKLEQEAESAVGAGSV